MCNALHTLSVVFTVSLRNDVNISVSEVNELRI